jgi:hypothetical protein
MSCNSLEAVLFLIKMREKPLLGLEKKLDPYEHGSKR